MARPFDVCIRGAGITGRTLALLLAKERLKVGLVVQETPQPVHDVRAYALNHKSRALLESVRCWPDVADATPVLKMQVRGDDGGEVVFNASENKSDALAWIVDVPVLESRLAQATQFQAGIELLDQAQAATLTVVCEGKASSSRAEFGVDFDVTPYSQRAIAARVQGDKPHLQTARQWFAGGAILGVLPMGSEFEGQSGNSLAIVWSVEETQAQTLMQLGEVEFCNALQAASHDCYGALTLTGERAVWPLQLAQTRTWIGRMADVGVGPAGATGPGRAWALAGDAAHSVHPLSGQGLNLGLADVAELATLLGRRDYWRGVGDEKMLRRYERSRKAELAMLAAGTDGLQRLFAQNGSPWQALRNQGMNGFERSGPLKNWVARRAMGA